jgi:hypothetical protein
MTTQRNVMAKRFIATLLVAAAVVFSVPVMAHCDTLDGPVVAAARKALDSGNVNLILVWVQKKDEGEIRTMFQKARAVRKAGGQAKELADMYFFETLVRVHRMGEGAAYTGLKPAGTIEPAVAASDRSVETGKLEEVATLVAKRMEQGLHRNFEAVMAKRKYDPNDVDAGRAFSSAYVEYVHYVERLYGAADSLAPSHAADLSAHKH